MIQAYLSALFQTWAADKTKKNWRGFWRLKKLGIRWQLMNVQKISTEIELTSPVIILDTGEIEIFLSISLTNQGDRGAISYIGISIYDAWEQGIGFFSPL